MPARTDAFSSDGFVVVRDAIAPDVIRRCVEAIEDELCRRYHLEVVGRAEALRQRFYAISVERKIKHPAVVAICESARKDLFS